MRKFEGTKGEWKVSDDNIQINIGDVKYTPNKESFYGSSAHEASANAKLIAAAPELLEVLILLKKEYEQLVDSGDCGNWNPRADDCVVASNKAINKALPPPLEPTLVEGTTDLYQVGGELKTESELKTGVEVRRKSNESLNVTTLPEHTKVAVLAKKILDGEIGQFNMDLSTGTDSSLREGGLVSVFKVIDDRNFSHLESIVRDGVNDGADVMEVTKYNISFYKW